MRLPPPLRLAIDEIAGEVEPAALRRASLEVVERYRKGASSSAALTSAAHRAAYLTLRLPATFAATHRVLQEAHRLAPGVSVVSLLDLGAGPGTATWAAAEVFGDLERAVPVERDVALVTAGLRLAANATHRAIVSAQWMVADLTSSEATLPAQKFDLVVLSYVLGELIAAEQQNLVALAWSRADKLVAIIEPGTTRGFENMLAARTALTAAGGHILAPCPRAQQHQCPMAGAGDWCHFSQRLERTSQHRRLKGGELGYEDEKFSYCVLSKDPTLPASARIVRHPLQRKGHIQLQLCTPAGLQHITVTKSDRKRYRAARQAEWGDEWVSDL
jgi:ribosomal protein RSM22 (predicted rRNA methylase)